ncbi:Peptidase A1 domain-containing protein [Aphelenchoides bicaudatus]|nr:Peptidase A1 domain-containing protein [Aphelenchoides bicaudatus]
MKSLLVLLIVVQFVLACVATENNGFKIPLHEHRLSADIVKARQAVFVKNNKFAEGGVFKTDYLSADLFIGTPAQYFEVAVSNGLSDAWVFDINATKQYPDRSNGYNATESKTSKALNKQFELEDGFFYVSGSWYKDTMNFDGIHITQSFGSVLNTGAPFITANGTFGLSHRAPEYYEQGNPAAPIDQLLSKFQDKKFTLYLKSYQYQYYPKYNIPDSFLTLGARDDYCKTSPVTIQLESNELDDRYVANVDYFKYGSQTFNAPGSVSFDIGVSSLLFPRNELNRVIKLIGAKFDSSLGLYTYPCSEINELGLIEFGIQTYSFLITSYDYLINIGSNNGQCVLALEPNNPEQL